MDHIRIIKRAFDITIKYRILWIFGFILALTAGRGGGGGSGGGGGGTPGTTPAPRNFNGFPNLNLPAVPAWSAVAGIVTSIICVILILAVIFTILRYVAVVASIRMVNRYEDSGEKVTWREGFRLGWSRGAFRLWLVDLLFVLAGIIIVVLMIAVAAAPLLLLLIRNEVISVLSVVLTIGLLLMVILIIIVASALISLWLNLSFRAIVLEDLGVFDGLRRGFRMARARLWDVILMGLILFGISLAFGLVMVPVFFALLLAGVGVGGLPALLAYFITQLLSRSQELPIFFAVLTGLPLFLLVLIIPSTFIRGLYEIFTSSTWTLTYRELLALEAVGPSAPVSPVSPVTPVNPEEPLPPAEPMAEA